MPSALSLRRLFSVFRPPDVEPEPPKAKPRRIRPAERHDVRRLPPAIRLIDFNMDAVTVPLSVLQRGALTPQQKLLLGILAQLARKANTPRLYFRLDEVASTLGEPPLELDVSLRRLARLGIVKILSGPAEHRIHLVLREEF